MDSKHYDTEVLCRLRKASGLNQHEVGVKIGMSRPTIARMEAGTGADYDSLAKLAKFYGVPVTSILYPQPIEKNLA